MRKLILLIVMVATAAIAQQAKVVQLSPRDAAKAKQLHDAVLKAQEAEEAFRNWVKDTYLVAPETVTHGSCVVSETGNSSILASTATISGLHSLGEIRDACDPSLIAERKNAKERQEKWDSEHPTRYYADGWGCGEFEYSSDYKFIVPKAGFAQGQNLQCWYAGDNEVECPSIGLMRRDGWKLLPGTVIAQ